MDPIIEACWKPRGLRIFKTYLDLRRWLDVNKESLIKIGAVIRLTDTTITFPNGGKLYLGYGETEDELSKYWGLSYDFLVGGNEKLRRRVNV